MSGSKTKEAISRKFASLRTSYIRERKREKASAKSGAGADELHVSKWKLYKEMDFLRDEIEVEESMDNMNITSTIKKRKRSIKDSEDELKAEFWDSALKALRTSTEPTNLSDPDEQWLLKLAPQIKALTPQQKSLVRLKFQMLLHDVQFPTSTPVDAAIFRWTEYVSQYYISKWVLDYT